MKAITEYVTCAVCGQRYAGKVPRGGDGSELFPRKHYRYNTGVGRFRSKKQKPENVCPGSFMPAKAEG